jgi:hypothetical protein
MENAGAAYVLRIAAEDTSDGVELAAHIDRFLDFMGERDRPLRHRSAAGVLLTPGQRREMLP